VSHPLTDADFERVKVIARLVRRSCPHADMDDLIGDGTIGLLTAARRHDPEHGAFSTYSAYRIRGEMVDGLRRQHGRKSRAQTVSIAGQTDPVDPAVLCDTMIDPDDAMETLDRQLDARRRVEQIRGQLGPVDRNIVDLMLTGMNQAAVADVIHLHFSRVSQRLKNIRELVGAAA
jgi:RNA polymerase sigma factor (sigma-70 family)